jgi:hypothetical protein
MQILVFKTNLTDISHINAIGNRLNVHPAIFKWNVDLQGCDNILGVVANNIPGKEVEMLLENAGYFCEELE